MPEASISKSPHIALLGVPIEIGASQAGPLMGPADVEKPLRERFATLSDVERPAADGDFVVIDLTATRDGEAVEGAELTGMSYQVGRGGMIDGLDEALAGMAAGAWAARRRRRIESHE